MSAIAFLTLGLVSLLLFFGFFQSLVHGFGNLGKAHLCFPHSFELFFGNLSVKVGVSLVENLLHPINILLGWWWPILFLRHLLEESPPFIPCDATRLIGVHNIDHPFPFAVSGAWLS